MKIMKIIISGVLFAAWAGVSLLYLLGEPASGEFNLLAWLFMKIGAGVSLYACVRLYCIRAKSGKMPRLWGRRTAEQELKGEEL